jgi:uncharacterized membrane protein
LIVGLVNAGHHDLTNQPVPVDVAHQRVLTISPTVVSSNTVAAAVVIVVLLGTTRVLIPDREVTSLSIKAQALVTFVVSVTSADASIQSSFVSSAVVNDAVVAVSTALTG